MGNKRTSKQTLRPQQTYAEMVKEHIKPFVAEQINFLGSQLAGQQRDMLEMLYIRLTALEELVMEKLDLPAEDLSNKVVDLQDKLASLESVDDEVRLGDRVRITVSTKTVDQVEFAGSSKMMIDNAGSGQTIGAELESALIGLKAGTTVELKFGSNKELDAKIEVNKISRTVAKK